MIKKLPLLSIWFGSIVLCLTIFTFFDYLRFKRIIDGKVKDSWYDNSWVFSPFKRTLFMFLEGKEYWTYNATKTQGWLVREYKIESTIFWTQLKVHDIPVEQQLKLTPPMPKASAEEMP